ncbi:MAG: beta strand repeat-containing protein [Candidatus Spyradenecus sp.]
MQYATGATSAQETLASVTIRAKNAYTSGVAPTNGNAEMVYGYLDDGETDTGYGAQMAFSFIPYSQYDLYIYIGSDGDGTIGAVEVNGTWYPSQSTAWGARADSRAAEVTLTENSNYLKIAGLTSTSLTIKGAKSGDPNNTRTGLAGVQIVNTGDVLTATNYTATASDAAVTFSDVVWSDGSSGGQSLTGGALNTATLTLEPGSTLTFTEAVPTLNKLTLVSTGKVTLAVNGVTLDQTLANVANFDFTGVTELDIGALTKSALTVPEGVTLTMNTPEQVTTLTRTAGSTLKLTGDRSGTHNDVLVLQNDTALETVGNLTISDDVSDTLNGRTWTLSGGTSTVTGGLYTRSSTTENGWMSPGQTSFFTMKDGATLTVESARSTLGQNRSDGAVMFAECGGTGTPGLTSAVVSISGTGTRLSVPNGAVNLSRDGTATVTVSDGATLEAYKLGNQKNNSTLTVQTGATLTLGKADATDSVLKVTVGSVTLADGAILSAKSDWNVDAATAANAIAITGALTVKPEGHTITLRQTNFSEGSSLALVGTGVLDLSALGKNLPKIASIEAGTTLRVAPFSQSDRLTGNFSVSLPLAEGATLSGTIEYQDGDTWKAATVTSDGTTATLSGTLSTNATLTGSSWWWDYEFNGSNVSSGSDRGEVTLEGSAKSYSADNQALYFQKTPWRVATYPAELTAVMRCQPGNSANTALICFGSTATTASPNVAIALVTGDEPENGDMRLVLILRNGTTVTVTDLVEGGLNVANATTAQHLYAFSIATVDGKTQIAVYVDGKRKTLYTHPTTIALSGGFQIGSLHGGVEDNDGAWTTGLSRYPDSGDSGTVDFLRVSKEVLTDAAIKAMANAYPYVSAKGVASRTVSEATATWEDETNPWSQAMPNAEATAQAAPNAGTNVALTASADTTITLNGTTAVTYESMTFEGTGAVTLSATATSATMLASDLTVSTNLTVPAHRFTAGTVSVDEGKTLTFDCSGLDGLKTTYVLTGYVEPDVAERIAVANTEIAGSPFTYEKAQNSAGSVILRATSVKPLTATVSANCAWSAIEWTWEGNTTPTALGNVPSVSDITLTLENEAVISPASALAISGTLTMSGSGLLDLPTGSTVVTTAIGDGTTLQLHQAQAAVVTTRSGLAGTFKFVGGTNDKPLLIQTNDFPGAIAVAANSYIKIAHSGGNVKYVVSGEGKTSTVWISGSKGWGTDPDGTKFTNVKLAITGGNTFWMRAGSTEDVWLDITQGNSVSLENNAVNGSAVTDRLIVRALTGGGTIQKGSGVTGERYVCLHNPDEAAATFTRSGTISVPLMFTGAWSIAENLDSNYLAITVGDGTLASTLTLSGQNGNYTGKTITIAEKATLESTSTDDVTVPFGKGANAKIVNNGTLRVGSSNGQIPPVEGTGDVVIGANCRLAGALTTTGKLTVPAGYTLDLSRAKNDTNVEDTFDGTPSINGPSVECKGMITSTSTSTSATVTIPDGETLSGTGTIGVPLTFESGATLDVTNGALTAAGTVTCDGTVTVTGATAATTTILPCSNPAAVATKLTGAPAGYKFAATETAVVLAKAGNYKVGDKTFETFEDALAEITAGTTKTGTITIDASAPDTIPLATQMVVNDVGANITLDLGGKKLVATADLVAATLPEGVAGATGAIWVRQGALTVKNGSLESAGVALRAGVYAGEVAAKSAKLTLEETFSATAGADVMATMEGCEVVTAATLSTEAAGCWAIYGNGAKNNNTAITITGGSITSAIETAIYHPQGGTLTITGGTIVGTTALYVKGGTVSISGGAFWGTGAEEAYASNGNGATATGDALVIDNDNRYAPLMVTITGGSFASYYAEPIASYSNVATDVLTGFVADGKFSTAIAGSLCADGKCCVANTDSETSTPYPWTIGTLPAISGGESGDVTINTPEAKDVIGEVIADASTTGGAPTAVVVLPGTKSGAALLPTEVADALAIFGSSVTTTATESGTLKITVSYDFGIDSMKQTADGIEITAKVQKSGGAVAAFAEGVTVKLVDGDGATLEGGEKTLDAATQEVTFTIPVEKIAGKTFKVKATK